MAKNLLLEYSEILACEIAVFNPRPASRGAFIYFLHIKISVRTFNRTFHRVPPRTVKTECGNPKKPWEGIKNPSVTK